MPPGILKGLFTILRIDNHYEERPVNIYAYWTFYSEAIARQLLQFQYPKFRSIIVPSRALIVRATRSYPSS